LDRIWVDTLLTDTSLFFLPPFDPNVQYDFQRDRFYMTYAQGDSSASSKVALLVSKSNDPRDGWWEYALYPYDSLNNQKWLDRPELGFNGQSIFVACTMISDTGGPAGNKVFQIEIASILAGNPMVVHSWEDLKDANGNLTFPLVPASLGQAGTYGPDFYFVASDRLGGEQYHLYHYRKLPSGDTIETSVLQAPAYELPLNADQLGSTDELSTKDCRIQDALYLNGKIHFVHQVSFGGIYSAISYQRLTVSNLALTSEVYGAIDSF
jgi:hypothetical protein